jgi:hypothetical protein
MHDSVHKTKNRPLDLFDTDCINPNSVAIRTSLYEIFVFSFFTDCCLMGIYSTSQYFFHVKPHFFKTLFQSQFLFDFDEICTNKSENVCSFCDYFIILNSCPILMKFLQTKTCLSVVLHCDFSIILSSKDFKNVLL